MSQVKNKFLAQAPANTLKGNNTGSTANVTDLTVSQVQTMLLYPGDIAPTTFVGANNQSTPTNVTGLAFANATVHGFEALVNVAVIATASLYEQFRILGTQRGSDWSIGIESSGDATGVVFSITSAGQLQYTDLNYSGFTSITFRFRAEAM